MHNIGNFHDAQTILHWVRSHEREYGIPLCALDAAAPLGWEYLGRGSFRSVWRSPEGVAYKVGHSSGYNQCGEEISNLGYAWREGAIDGVRLPRFDSFEVEGETVVAIEVIDGQTLDRYRGRERSRLWSLMRKIETTYQLWDMHDQNCMVDLDGYLVPVDFGG